MGVILGGTSLDSLVWNVRSRAPRMATAARRGGNVETAGLDGTVWQPGKPLAELDVDLVMWIVGSDPDGDMPDEPRLQRRVATRYEQLQRLIARQDQLVEVVDTDSQRRCYAEIQEGLTPGLQAGGSRAEISLPLVVPAGCWEDLATFDTGPQPLPSSGEVTVTGAGGSTLPTLGVTVTLTPPGRNVRLETVDGDWLLLAGDLPTGGDTVVSLDPWTPDVIAPDGTSLLSALTWNTAAPLPLPAGEADPVLSVTAEATTTDSAIAIAGRRRWLSA